MADRRSRFNGRVFGYRWADYEWVATVFEFPECAEVWISARCEPRKQMMFAFTTPVAEVEAINRDFVVSHPAARQTMTGLAYEYQMDIDEYADSINALYEIDELATSKQHDERKNTQAERAEKARCFNLGPIGIEVTSAKHPTA